GNLRQKPTAKIAGNFFVSSCRSSKAAELSTTFVGMGDAFALLRAGTTFDRQSHNVSEIGRKVGTEDLTSSSVDIPKELDFFGEAPKVQEKPPVLLPEKSKKRKRG